MADEEGKALLFVWKYKNVLWFYTLRIAIIRHCRNLLLECMDFSSDFSDFDDFQWAVFFIEKPLFVGKTTQRKKK